MHQHPSSREAGEQVFSIFKFYRKMGYLSHKDSKAEKFLKHRKEVQPLGRKQRRKGKKGGRDGGSDGGMDGGSHY